MGVPGGVGKQQLDLTGVNSAAFGALYVPSSGGDLVMVRDNRVATTDPTIANDQTQGYAPGSIWVNTTAGRVWFCADASTGAAVWTGTGSGMASAQLRYTGEDGVPGGAGVRWLHLGHKVQSSEVGEALTRAGTLCCLTISLDAPVGAGRTYRAELVKDPTGTPVVVGFLDITATEQVKRTTALSGAIAVSDLIGVRMRLTAGTGNSDFDKFVVNAEVALA